LEIKSANPYASLCQICRLSTDKLPPIFSRLRFPGSAARKPLGVFRDPIAKPIKRQQPDILIDGDPITAGSRTGKTDIFKADNRNRHSPLASPLGAAARPVGPRNDAAPLAPSGERILILPKQGGKITEK
jgi:hypothetical protein